MCKLGDIIIIEKFKNELGKTVKKHSFVVINDKGNYIEGLRYDFACNMICSFHNNEHKLKKLSYKENIEIIENMTTVKNSNQKEGYIKANQLYYFNKHYIKYCLIGKINPKMLNKLFMLIMTLMDEKRENRIITNLESNKRGGHYE